MATIYPMPKWGITMEEGTVTQWVATIGQHVQEGDVLAVIGTDKIENDYESPAAGILAALLVPEGATVECGADLLVIADNEEDLAAWSATH